MVVNTKITMDRVCDVIIGQFNYLEFEFIEKIGARSFCSLTLAELRDRLMETSLQACLRAKDKEKRNKDWKEKNVERKLFLASNPVACCASMSMKRIFHNEHAECHHFHWLRKEMPV